MVLCCRVAAYIRLDLSIRLGSCKRAVWSDHIVLPCWCRDKAKGCLYRFTESEDIKGRAEEPRIDFRFDEGVCRCKGN